MPSPEGRAKPPLRWPALGAVFAGIVILNRARVPEAVPTRVYLLVLFVVNLGFLCAVLHLLMKSAGGWATGHRRMGMAEALVQILPAVLIFLYVAAQLIGTNRFYIALHHYVTIAGAAGG